MKAYRIRGRFRMGLRRTWHPFTQEVAAADEGAARERVLSVLGSRHGVPRKYIAIDDVAELPADRLEDAVVRYTLEVGS